MGQENLTRDEALERSELIDVESYDVQLDLAGDGETYRSQTTVKFRSSKEGAATFIDFIAPLVTSATLNGQSLDVAAHFDGARLTLPNLATENELTIVGDAKYMHTGEGLHRFVDPVDNEPYLYTQFEPADARRVFACFDQPNLKATFTFSVTAPEKWVVVSGGPVISQEPIDGNRVRWQFKETQRISTYITAIIAGPYESVNSELTSSDGRTIPLGLYCRPSLMDAFDYDEIFRLTKIGFEYFEKAFDQPYPFDKYDQIFVPEFNSGAMENAGAVTYRDQYIFRSKVSDAMRERRALTVLHELAHMWFGNLVTMAWWDDLWLNESFAEWASTCCMAEATEYTTSWTTFAVHEKNWAYRQDQLPSTHPIQADMVDLDAVGANFDGITYAKGASTLKHLVHYVGRDNFDAALRTYFGKHKWSNTEFDDLVTELEAASGRDLSDWTGRWLASAGVNTLESVVTTTAGDTIESVVITQTAPGILPTLRPHRLVIGCYTLDGDTVTRTHRIELDIDGTTTEVTELAGQARPDLLLINDEDYTYSKVRLDPASREFALKNIHRIDDSLARVLVWTSLWDSVRDAELRARDLVELFVNHLHTEDDSSIRRTLLQQLSSLVETYVAEPYRQTARTKACDALWQWAKDAEAGSDAQHMYVQTLSSLAADAKHLDIVESLLTGSEKLNGLDVDDDLTWDLVKSLAAGGRLDEKQIDEYLAKDHTSGGELGALYAKAAIPTAEHKATTWSELMTNDDLANDKQLAILMGFARVHDASLLEPFVDPYFQNIEGLWQRRTQEMAAQCTLYLYPHSQVSQQIIARTETFVAEHNDLKSAARRILEEEKDSMQRVLRVRQTDAGMNTTPPTA